MKAATISQLKKELAKLDREDLLDVCVRLANFKVESKELLTYLLMKADDEIGYAKLACLTQAARVEVARAGDLFTLVSLTPPKRWKVDLKIYSEGRFPRVE